MGIDTQATSIVLVMSGVHQSGFLLPIGVTVHFPMRDSMAFLVRSMSGS